MLLAVYGTLRKGEYLHEYIEALTGPFEHSMEVAEVPGVSIYILGDVPGAKLEKGESSVMELWKFSIPKGVGKALLRLLDAVEDVAGGLYKQDSIDTHLGKALIYTYLGSTKGLVKIKDWKEWQKKDPKERIEAARKAGNRSIGIRSTE